MLLKNPRWKARLKKVPGLVRLVRLCRIIGDSGYRSEWRLKRDKPDNLFQPYSLTGFDHPHIFAFVCDRLSAHSASRLLSYGCSTGEEVFTLRNYFPQAEIVGIDINPRSIHICRKQLERGGATRIRFKLARSPDAEPDGCYDAVFCLSVLRHGELGASHPESCDHLIRFIDFEKTVESLCRSLKLGGYLILRGSNFRFCDTVAAIEFDTVQRG